MKEEKSIGFLAVVFPIQGCNPVLGKSHERPVFRHVLLVCITAIRQETKMHIVIAVGKKPNLQGFDQLSNALRRCEHGWNHNESTQLRWDSPEKFNRRHKSGIARLVSCPLSN